MIALKKLERYRNLTKNSMLVSPFAGTICDFDNQNQQNWINLVCFKATAMFGQHFGISLSRALRALRAIWTLHLTPRAASGAFTLVMKYGEMYLVGEMRHTRKIDMELELDAFEKESSLGLIFRFHGKLPGCTYHSYK